MITTRIILTITACALLGAGCSYSQDNAARNTQRVASEWLREPSTSTLAAIDADVFAIPELMANAESLEGEQGFVCRKFRAGIVNHHALASDLLAGFFRTLARCRPDARTVIILSPDHFQQAPASIVTHHQSYTVSGMELESDAEVVERLLLALPFAREAPSIFIREHGVGALLPFMVGSLKDVRLVPVMIRSQISDADRAAVSSWLREEMKRPGTFVIVSSDMSHYLSEERAKSNDMLTKKALETGDAEFFAKANDDFTDNGESIATTLGALGKTTWHELGTGISSDYAGSPGFTTTYVIGFWD